MGYCDHLPSVVCPSALLNDFSETLRPIFFKLHVKPSVEEGLKNCTNDHGPLIKMAAVPVWRKNTVCFFQNHESFEARFRYIAFGTQGLPSLFKW